MSRKMKDSGIEWIGEIPGNWEISAIKRFCKLKTGTTPSSNDLSYFDGDFDWYTPGDFSDGLLLNDASRKLQYKAVEDGLVSVYPAKSVLIIGIGATTGKIGFTLREASSNQQITAIIPNEEVDNKYLLYYLFTTSSVVRDTALFTTLPILNNQTLGKFCIPIPMKQEQEKIVNYLDAHCTLIDKTIEKQKQVIEKLKEYKQSVISEAVTKGMNQNVPMKDSGIEWIEEIPKHWDITQLSNLLSERKCKNRGNSETNVLSLSYGSIKKRNVETNMGLLPESFETYNIIEPGNIVLRLTDLQNDHKSLRCGLVKENGIITSAYVTLEKKSEISEINTEYFYRLLHMFDIKKGFYGMGDGVRQNLKYNGELNKLLIVLPPVTEQNEIVDFLNERCEAIDNAIKIKEAEIQKLDEYKKSLIYECVTGKREVK